MSRTYPVAESGLSGNSYEEKLVELGLDTLEERRHQADMAMVHKILHGKGKLDHIYIGLRMPWMAKGPPGMQLTPPQLESDSWQAGSWEKLLQCESD